MYRNEFDGDSVPELSEDLLIQDIHSISSLLKMYFRDLPNPLFTYQLYDKFVVSDPIKALFISDTKTLCRDTGFSNCVV